MATDRALINAIRKRNSGDIISFTSSDRKMKMKMERNISLTCPVPPAPILSFHILCLHVSLLSL